MTEGLVRQIRGLEESELSTRLVRPLTSSARSRRAPRLVPQIADQIGVRVVQTLLAVGLQQHSINFRPSLCLRPDVLVPHDIAHDVDRDVRRLRLLSASRSTHTQRKGREN